MRTLPGESSTPSSARRLAALLLGALLLVVAANEAARRALRAATPNIGYALVPQKWRLLLERRRPVDWLVLGDSSCNQGVDPALLSQQLGGEALNLCTVASSLALDSAWMLDWHVAELGAPRAVLAVHSYHLWQRPLEPFAVAHVPLPWGFWSRLEPRLRPDAAWRLRGFAARYLPLYAEHKSLARLLMRPWEARRHYQVDARGFMPVARARARGVEKDARKRLDWLAAQQEARVSEPNRRALARLGELAGRHGFPVYLANAPVYEAIAAAPAFRRYQARLAGELRAIAARHPGLVWLDREFRFARKDMQNGDHLLAAAAARYTRALAAELQRGRETRLAGP